MKGVFALCHRHRPRSCSFARHADQLVTRSIRFCCKDIQQNRYAVDSLISGFSPSRSRSAAVASFSLQLMSKYQINKSVYELLGCSHFAICRGSLGLFALCLVQCQRRLQISDVKNIGNVVELSGVAFRLAPTL